MTQAIIALFTLTLMEIVLGIDNLVFISILTGRLPESQRMLAYRVGLGLALIMRIALLGLLFFFVGGEGEKSAAESGLFRLTSIGVPEYWIYGDAGMPPEDEEVVTEWPHAEGGDHPHTAEVHSPVDIDWISIRDLILLGGGLFLIGKSTHEIHEKIDGDEEEEHGSAVSGFTSVLIQIALLDIVFSLDSVITAVGMAKEIWVMIVAVLISVGLMLVFAKFISDFVHKHPTVKMLALSFLILIGVLLVTEAVGTPLHRGYVYFAMGFSLAVEVLNILARRATTPKEKIEEQEDEKDTPDDPAAPASSASSDE